MKSLPVLAAILAATATSTAFAHATLETREAPADSYYKAVIRVGHGCDGSPTLTLRLQIPDGVVAVKPMPKPGWTLDTVIAPYPQPVDLGHGRSASEGVREVVWSGRLLDAHYDEFVARVKLPDRPGATLYFPVVQACEKGAHRWIEIPAAGRSTDDLEEPAPALKLGPKAGH